MYIIQEIQTTDGVPAFLPPVTKATREEAESAFYYAAGAAVVSAVPEHTVMTYTHEGFVIPELTKCFKHAAVPAEIAEEPEE